MSKQFDVQVVGAAILDSLENPTKILLSQRSGPESLRGKWEFPGGKVDAGETCQEALVRELVEELGIETKLSVEIPGPFEQGWQLTERHAMRVWCAEISAGEPRALEGQLAVQWFDVAETLKEIDWIPADFPIVEALLATIQR
ncbi:(deoxy)nucleoside triphosphate pyrophosphohydrolase [Rothia terrae]|jgi:8-oxo-dGTP diphosphatase|uniref:(deoxy)nucleoside triphosphate pyrophosphohydrolase n=1 Tax=Rothia terrae TaxID=396015 RepID=UPI003825828B